MMKLALFLLLLLFVVSPAQAADLGTPNLSPPLNQTRFFDTDNYLTTGGISYSAAGDVKVQPEFGVGHRALERDLPGALEESIQLVHAQAGWRLILPNTLYLSAAAKLPIFSYESTGHSLGQDINARQSYDFGHPLRSALNWNSEMGIHLTPGADLTLYFDQSQIGGALPGMSQQEQRIGTRIIWHFK